MFVWVLMDDFVLKILDMCMVMVLFVLVDFDLDSEGSDYIIGFFYSMFFVNDFVIYFGN